VTKILSQGVANASPKMLTPGLQGKAEESSWTFVTVVAAGAARGSGQPNPSLSLSAALGDSWL